MIRRLLSLGILVVMVWGLLVFALPGIALHLPEWCARWGLTDGVCGERIQGALHAADAWSEANLRPFATSDSYEALLARAYTGLAMVGVNGLDDDDGAASVAVSRIEGSLDAISERVDRHSIATKVGDVPGNARELLGNARDATANLRAVLSDADRSVEEIREAVNRLRQTLDVLSAVLLSSESDER